MGSTSDSSINSDYNQHHSSGYSAPNNILIRCVEYLKRSGVRFEDELQKRRILSNFVDDSTSQNYATSHTSLDNIDQHSNTDENIFDIGSTHDNTYTNRTSDEANKQVAYHRECKAKIHKILQAPDIKKLSSKDCLGLAVQQNLLKETKAIIDRGVGVNIEYDDEMTPLLYAIESGSLEMVKLLINNKAKLDILGHDETTPLYYAAQSHCVAIVELLIDKGANINDKCDKNGSTPLSWAVRSGDKDMVQYLLTKGSDINASDHDDMTAYSYATDCGYHNIVKILDQYTGITPHDFDDKKYNDIIDIQDTKTSVDIVGGYDEMDCMGGAWSCIS